MKRRLRTGVGSVVWPCGQDSGRQPEVHRSSPMGTGDGKSVGKQSSGCRARHVARDTCLPGVSQRPRLSRKEILVHGHKILAIPLSDSELLDFDASYLAKSTDGLASAARDLGLP